MMTRKDYVEFANALGDALSEAQDSNPGNTVVRDAQVRSVMSAIEKVAGVLNRDNGSFRHGQFMEAIEFRATTGKLVKVGQTRFNNV